MKIYEIGTGYTPIPAQMGAATEIVVEELTKAMLKQKYDVTIIDIAAENRAKNDLPIIEVPVNKALMRTDVQLGVMHKLKRIVYSISLASTLKEIIKNEPNDIILHFHNQYNMYFFEKLTPKKLCNKCKIIYTNHSYIWHGNWDEIKKTVKKRYFQEIFSMKKADFVFVLNEKTKYLLVNNIGIEASKIYMINNGVNINVYKPMDDKEERSFRQEQGLMEKRVFVQIGSVCERKNQLGSLRLLLPTLKSNKDYIFLYAGGIISEEYHESIKVFAKMNGIEEQVKYVGELKPGAELNRYYSVADAMIFPSKLEGFSLVILEAMAAGTPVLIEDKLNFKLANECLRFKDEKEFNELMKKYILNSDEKKILSNRVRNAVMKEYGWDRIASEYIKVSMQ